MSYTIDKMVTAIKTLKSDVEYSYNTENGFGASTEEEFNAIKLKEKNYAEGLQEEGIWVHLCNHP